MGGKVTPRQHSAKHRDWNIVGWQMVVLIGRPAGRSLTVAARIPQNIDAALPRACPRSRLARAAGEDIGVTRQGHLLTSWISMLWMARLPVMASVTSMRRVYLPAASVSGSVSFFTR